MDITEDTNDYSSKCNDYDDITDNIGNSLIENINKLDDSQLITIKKVRKSRSKIATPKANNDMQNILTDEDIKKKVKEIKNVYKVFCMNPEKKYDDSILLALILTNKKLGIEYKCCICNNEGVWKKKPLTLILKHKTGSTNDYSPDNIILYCPNCYSQKFDYKIHIKKTKIIKCNNDRCKFDLTNLPPFYRNVGWCKLCYKHVESSTKDDVEKRISKSAKEALCESASNSDVDIDIADIDNNTNPDDINSFDFDDQINTDNQQKKQYKKKKLDIQTSKQENKINLSIYKEIYDVS